MASREHWRQSWRWPASPRSRTPVEEAFAQLVGDGFRPEAVTEELGTRWEITRNYFRLRACRNPIYSAVDALEDILTEHKPALP